MAKRMKRNTLEKEDNKTKICQQFLRDKYEQHIRSDFIEAFGFFFCKKTMKIPFLDQELKTVCNHPIATDNTINYKHNEFAVYLKNILLWLDAKMKYSNNNNISKDPGRILKVSHIMSQEKISRLCLYYQPKNFEKPSTQAKSSKKKKNVLNDYDNLAIAGPSGNVNVSKTPVNKNPLKRKYSDDPDDKSDSNNSKIQADKNMYARNRIGETKMHTACAKGKYNVVCSLLAGGFNPNVKDNAGWTPLHGAVRKGYLDIVNILIKYGAFLNVPGFEYESPLHTAIKYENFDIAVILLKHGADVNQINLFGDNAQSLNPEKWSEIFKNNDITLRQPSSIIQLYNYKSNQIVVFPMKLTIKNSMVKHFSKKFNIKIVQHFLNKDIKLAEVTHIIVPKTESNVCDINLESLTGIANGLFIVNENWISDSLEKCKLLDCKNYEVDGTTKFPKCGGASISRLHKIKLYPKLFDGINVHVSGNIGWKQFTRDNIKQLVLEFGAKLLQRLPNPEDSPTNIIPYHCRDSEQMRYVSSIVLYTEDSHRLIKYNMKHLKVFPISWFMEVIQKYSLD